ncbi:MAG: Maf family nucleotide pyrophosphatase [Roseiarcus sp.]
MPAPTLWIGASPIILASKSASRRALLAGVGVPFEVEAADIDERGVEEALSQRGEAPSGLALALARAKALSVSARRPEALTLGADQTLILDGQPMHKAPTRAAAAVALQAMSGRGHRLVSAFALARDGMILAEDSDSADMTMRALDAAQIARYLDIAGPAVLASVGAYQIEGLGAHLFESISGDQATILGLPMLKLLAALRGLGLLAL